MPHSRFLSGLRSRKALVAAGAAALVLPMLVATTASANLAGSTFEGNDGNMVVNTAGNTDWANVGGVSTGIDRPSGSTDNSFGQGTKEDNATVTVVSGSIPPNKNDLSRFYLASSLGANNHNYLELAWERLVNIGNANLDFEINQKSTTGFSPSTTGPVTLNRTAGDLLVSYDFAGSGTPTLGLNFWLTAAAGNTVSQCYSANALPCWGRHISLSGTVSEGAVNTVSIVDPLQSGSPSLGVGLFGEASIDLTAAGVFPAGICEAFGSAFVKSRSSSSFTAEVKDFIAPIPVNITNCGTVVIRKVTENGDSSFGYAATGLDPTSFSLSNGQSRTYSAVPVGTSSVTENLTSAQTAAGWTLKSLSCTATGTGTSASTSGATASISMGAGGTVDCTYTNNLTFHPSIATQLSASKAKVGDSITDSATMTGASPTAGGTVTYSAYAGQNTCTGTDLLDSTKTVTNGVVPNSDAFIAAAAGYYSFQAVYSGDIANVGASSVCSTEQLLVQAQPTAATAQHLIPNDSFTLSGATSTAGGTITMSLYGPADATCAGTPALTETVTVSGNGTYSTSNSSFVASTEGTWRWQSSYSGDALNLVATSSCGTERFTLANS